MEDELDSISAGRKREPLYLHCKRLPRKAWGKAKVSKEMTDMTLQQSVSPAACRLVPSRAWHSVRSNTVVQIGSVVSPTSDLDNEKYDGAADGPRNDVDRPFASS